MSASQSFSGLLTTNPLLFKVHPLLKKELYTAIVLLQKQQTIKGYDLGAQTISDMSITSEAVKPHLETTCILITVQYTFSKSLLLSFELPSLSSLFGHVFNRANQYLLPTSSNLQTMFKFSFGEVFSHSAIISQGTIVHCEIAQLKRRNLYCINCLFLYSLPKYKCQTTCQFHGPDKNVCITHYVLARCMASRCG